MVKVINIKEQRRNGNKRRAETAVTDNSRYARGFSTHSNTIAIVH